MSSENSGSNEAGTSLVIRPRLAKQCPGACSLPSHLELAPWSYRPTRSTNFEIEANSPVWVCRLGGAKSVLLCGRYGCLRQGRCCCFRERLAAADQTGNFGKRLVRSQFGGSDGGANNSGFPLSVHGRLRPPTDVLLGGVGGAPWVPCAVVPTLPPRQPVSGRKPILGSRFLN